MCRPTLRHSPHANAQAIDPCRPIWREWRSCPLLRHASCTVCLRCCVRPCQPRIHTATHYVSLPKSHFSCCCCWATTHARAASPHFNALSANRRGAASRGLVTGSTASRWFLALLAEASRLDITHSPRPKPGRALPSSRRTPSTLVVENRVTKPESQFRRGGDCCNR